MPKTTSTPPEDAAPALAPNEHAVTQAALAEYLANAAVNELVIAEIERGVYRLECSLSWRPGTGVLVAARGSARTFRSLDTLATFLQTMGTGATLIRFIPKS